MAGAEQELGRSWAGPGRSWARAGEELRRS